MPILGITASSQQSAFIVSNSYESISTVTVGSGGSATITFSSIPATYTHLQIRGIGRCNDAGDRTALSVMINSDNGSNYVTHILSGTGATASSQNFTGQTGSNNQIGGSSTITGAAAGASIFGMAIIDILDYKNTNKYKVIRTLAGQDQNSSSGRITSTSGLYLSTTAITSISLSPSGTNFVEYSQFALYGIKGA